MNIIERHLRHGPHRIRRPILNIIVHAHAEQIPVTDEVVAWYAEPGNYTRDGLDLSDLAGTDVYAATWLDRLGLSAHALAAPGGELIRCREDWQGAYHARGYNLDTLGIEVLVPGSLSYAEFIDAMDEDGWVGDEQLETTAGWIAERMLANDLESHHVKGHYEVDPHRKRDPGAGFPWDRLFERIAELQGGA